MRRINTLIICTIIAVMALSAAGCVNKEEKSDNQEPVSIEVYAMDTYMTLTAYGDNANGALKESEREIKRIDSLLSTGNPDSEISKLNKEKRALVSDETLDLIKRAIEIGQDVDGVFDISVYPVMREWGFTDKNYKVPDKKQLKKVLGYVDSSKISLDEETGTVTFNDENTEIDLGGIAKGYTSDRIIEIMKDYKVEHALINLGGNVETLGKKPDGSEWRVAIADPEDDTNYVGGVEVHDKAVITSGGYQRFFEEGGKRYFHIIDLSDGFPAENGLISTTIVSDDGTLADALSTSLFIMGPEKAEEYWRNNKDKFDAVLIKDDGTVMVTAGLEDSYFSDGEYEVIR